jgi:hypothetical protein
MMAQSSRAKIRQAKLAGMLYDDLKAEFAKVYSEIPLEYPLIFKPYTDMKIAGCRGPDFGYFRYREEK